jgi:hypothetical protein
MVFLGPEQTSRCIPQISFAQNPDIESRFNSGLKKKKAALIAQSGL